MKSKISEVSLNGFKPFKIELEVETIQEARTLFHMFNHNEIMSLIQKDNNYCGLHNGTYSVDYENYIGIEVQNIIFNYITSQGFKV